MEDVVDFEYVVVVVDVVDVVEVVVVVVVVVEVVVEEVVVYPFVVVLRRKFRDILERKMLPSRRSWSISSSIDKSYLL